MFYKHLLKPILFKFDPEFVHDAFTDLGEFLGRYAVSRAATSLIYGYRGPDISKTIDGITYRTPIVLSAGFDYNARLTRILPALGFGGVEVGSVTARPCAGNTQPRLKRLPQSQSILVNKGLRNDGVDIIVKRLQLTPREPRFVIGVSLARTNDEQSATVAAGIEDYCYSLRKLVAANVGDYYTLNISCPNAFAGETFADPGLLRQLLERVTAIPCSKPVYVKLPINVPWEQLQPLLNLAIEYKLSGVIIGNLNKDYNLLAVRSEAPDAYGGGLSGQPCFERSNELIRLTRDYVGDRLTIMGCGGIFSPEDADVKLAAGADLLQLITGMIYQGPGLIKAILSNSQLIRNSSTKNSRQ